MNTKREQIIQALFAKLKTVAPIGGVYRSRIYALNKQSVPAITIEPLRDDADPQAVPIIDWALVVRVAVIVRGAAPDSLADPLVSQINFAIMSDQDLGGLAMDIEPGNVTFEILPGDQPIGVVSLAYSVKYRTTSPDLVT